MLQPDLVIMGGGEKQTIALLRKLGIAVYIMESSTYAQVKEELSNIAILTDATVRAKTILQYSDQKITEIQRNTAKQPHQQTIYYAWSGGRIFRHQELNRLPMILSNWLARKMLFRRKPINPTSTQKP
jgi:iron complex transport system substrate-binding protein